MTPAELAATHQLAFADERPWSSAEFADLLGQRGMILCGTPASYILGRVTVDEAEILTVATAPDQRRKGLARAATTAFCDEAAAAGAQTVFLEVASDNIAATKLYHSLNFAQVGQRRAYYHRRDGSRADALILRRVIAPARIA